MTKLVIDSYLYDVGTIHASPEAMVEDIIERTKKSWESGADIVMFPEYLWCNLFQYEDYAELDTLALNFWSRLWPKLKQNLIQSNKAVILGSVTFQDGEGLKNRAPMLIGAREIFQDKLCFTPWDSLLTGGDKVSVFDFKGFRCATLICLDIEMPSTAQLLKEQGNIDIIFVPSDTESVAGVERVHRCASARAVELSCAVVVSQLTGESAHDFVDKNIGEAALYLPSLEATKGLNCTDRRGVYSSGTYVERFGIERQVLVKGREDLENTDPSRVNPSSFVSIEIVQY